MQQAFVFVFIILSAFAAAREESAPLYFIKAEAHNKADRDKITALGIAIDGILSDSITVFGTQEEMTALKNAGIRFESSTLPERSWEFPAGDGAYHTYNQVVQALDALAASHPNIARRFSIGKSAEGRDLAGIRISAAQTADSLSTAVFLGCHHAREHLSIEVPLKLAEFLVNAYDSDPRVKAMVDTREIYVAPLINPDGAEYDIEDGSYRYWRKNRKDNGDGSRGVDLNRNYDINFGGEGASASPSSDIYHGASAFSEPETAAVREWLRKRKKTTVLISYHTFSELVLWPWGWTNAEIPNKTDLKVFETMGKKMATWNHYTAEKSSDLYAASGDMTDWAYEELKIFAYTFEMSPRSILGGGFYPGAQAIEPAFKANLEPALYLIEKAANPYSVIQKTADPLGVL